MENEIKSEEKAQRIDCLRILGVDGITGECVDVTPDYYIVDRAAAEERKQRLDRLAQITARKDVAFIWAVYKSMNRLMEDLPSKYVAMLFFLATYHGYDGYLTTGKKPIYKCGLPKLLDVSRTTAYRFWKAIEAAGIGREETDGRLRLDEQYFRRGAVSKQEIAAITEAGRHMSRLYIDSVREIYRRASSKSKNGLGHLLQIMPFVNYEYNIVCHNPAERELELIRPMSLGEVCQAIGYDEENASRLLEELSKLKFKVLDKETVAVRCVPMDDIHDRRAYKLFINPNVYYSGKGWDQVKVLGKF